jgi:DNA-binding transcriptional LysR family regulator
VLQAQGAARRVALRVPHFMSALAMVARSDAIITVPESVALRAAELFAARVFVPPLELPSVKAVMVWARQLDADAGHRWLRALLTSAELGPSAASAS